ncbi:hypothetical protein BASA61_002594 [Batrachochytrium salamandrivorans]|nr:hypothetical protein BASA61_002594 [Batrachochytrium salamandrivorans]
MAYDIEAELRIQLLDYFNIMKGIGIDGKKIKQHMLKVTQMAAYFELSDENKAILEELKTVYAVVMEEYGTIWQELIDEDCFTEPRIWMSPDEVIKRGPFPKKQ